MVRVMLLLVEDVAIHDWLIMTQHTNSHFTHFVPHREHRVVFPVFRPTLPLVEQAAKNTINLKHNVAVSNAKRKED